MILARARLPGLLLLAATAACREAGPPDPVILSLDEREVRRSDFERHLGVLKKRGLEGDDASVRRAVLDSFLEERALVLEASRRGLLGAGATPEAEQAAAQALLEGAAREAPVVEDTAIEAYYAANHAELGVPESIVLRQILVTTENEARDVRRRLGKEPKSFERLAQTRSRSPEASRGGLMGQFSRGQLPPELEAVAFALRPGAASEPVKTPLGYHVLRIDARGLARERSLEECRGEIRARLQREKADRAARQFVRSLLARAKVNYEAAQALRPR